MKVIVSKANLMIASAKLPKTSFFWKNLKSALPFQDLLEPNHDAVANERLDAQGVVEDGDGRVQKVLDEAALFLVLVVPRKLEQGPSVKGATS